MTDRAADAAVRSDKAQRAEPLVSLSEAARALGVSERTVRRRIERNELPGIKAGGRLMVAASALPGVTAPDTPSPVAIGQRRTVSDRNDTALVALVERQAQEIARLTGELAVAQERLKQLATGAAPDAPGSRQNAPHGAKGTDATGTPRSGLRAWWRRVFGGGS